MNNHGIILLVNREDYLIQLVSLFEIHPIVAILGPRQCGKTTLAKQYRDREPEFTEQHYFDLEDPTDFERLQASTIKASLEKLKGLIIIDEVQRIPELFPILRVLVDQEKTDRHFLILGSASRELIRQSSESLAGRIAYMELTPFAYEETHELKNLWLRGGFPRSYLAKNIEQSYAWRESYITTFLEQDIPNLGIQIPAPTLRRFWTMLSHYHANILNASEMARSFGISDMTVRRYLDILSGTFMIRQLMPWWENTKKRQVKAPKIYFRDSGLLHTLMRVKNEYELDVHTKLGASWEGFALEEIIRHHHAAPHDCYFWATHGGAELDLLLFIDNQRLGFEFKYSDAPKLTPSMKISVTELNLDHLFVIYLGSKNYTLQEKVTACGLENYLQQSLL
jgi:predicted AAA+ superfamily ATPase